MLTLVKREQVISIRMAIIKKEKEKNSKCFWGEKNIDIFKHCW